MDEVLESTDTHLRVEALLALEGLLTPVDRNGVVRRLHPLLREHCVRQLASQDPRERAVLAELRNGLRNREIADRLGVTEDGVRHHLKNIYRKTGTTDRDDAVRRAASMGVQF